MTLRWNWGTGIAAVYTTFALGTLSMVAFSMTQPVDLVTEQYYQRALEHDSRSAATSHANALGDQLQVAVTGAADAVRITWPAASLAPDATGAITLYRPSDARADRVVAFQPDASGQQHVPLAGLTAGLWRVQISWTAAGVTYYAQRDITVAR